MHPNRIDSYAPMNRQRDTKTRRRPPWVSGTGNQSQYINELYSDKKEARVCSNTTQPLRSESAYRSRHKREWR